MSVLNLRDFPDDLKHELKKRAADADVDLKIYVADVLRHALTEQKRIAVDQSSRASQTVASKILVNEHGEMIGMEVTKLVPISELEMVDAFKKLYDKYKSTIKPIPPVKPETARAVDEKRFPQDVPILCPKCKKEPMKARDEKTWRCGLCGHQEPR